MQNKQKRRIIRAYKYQNKTKLPREQILKNKENHAIRRLKQRYNIRIKRHDFRYVCKMIETPTKKQRRLRTLLWQDSRNKSTWELYIKNIKTIAIYDHDYKTIKTFMPLEYAAMI